MARVQELADILVCFHCSMSFREVSLCALDCRHLICEKCLTQFSMCSQCRFQRTVNQDLTNYIRQCNQCEDTELRQQIAPMKNCLDFLLVPCKRKEKCPGVELCPFDHSEYARNSLITVGSEQMQVVKICTQCNMRGPIENTKCVRCQTLLVQKKVKLMTGVRFDMNPTFTYFRNQGR